MDESRPQPFETRSAPPAPGSHPVPGTDLTLVAVREPWKALLPQATRGISMRTPRVLTRAATVA